MTSKDIRNLVDKISKITEGRIDEVDMNQISGSDSSSVMTSLRKNISDQVEIEREVKSLIQEIISEAKQIMLTSHDLETVEDSLKKMNKLAVRAFKIKKLIDRAPTKKILITAVVRLLEKLRYLENELKKRI